MYEVKPTRHYRRAILEIFDLWKHLRKNITMYFEWSVMRGGPLHLGDIMSYRATPTPVTPLSCILHSKPTDTGTYMYMYSSSVDRLPKQRQQSHNFLKWLEWFGKTDCVMSCDSVLLAGIAFDSHLQLGLFRMTKIPSIFCIPSLVAGWPFTNLCRMYAMTDVVQHNAYRRYDLFTTSVANLWPVVREVAHTQHYVAR